MSWRSLDLSRKQVQDPISLFNFSIGRHRKCAVMCGIFCAISRTTHIAPSSELRDRLRRRGPDSEKTVRIFTEGAHLTFCSTVLSLRGAKTVTQPFQDADDHYILCWNGEAWSFDGEPRTGNDTEAVHRLLMDIFASSTEDHSPEALNQSAAHVATALSRVAGPYAFMFYDAPRRRAFVGRDFLGRRSLLFRITPTGDLIFSSVCCGDHAEGWQELSADGVCCFSLRNTDSQPAHTRYFGDFASGHAPYNLADAGVDSRTSNKSVGAAAFYFEEQQLIRR